ncbi:MAG: hypothetical protein ACFFKA_09595 [Candidatus Thorarchaeota archaeon]
MSKVMLDNSSDSKFKKNVILISNLSASIGAILPILLFNILVFELENLTLWTVFFTACWFVSFPILFLTFFIRESKHNRELLNIETSTNHKFHIETNNTKIPLILLFLANFLIWGDKLIEFPYTSWILLKFGGDGMMAYSISFFIFTYLNMIGWAIARKVSNNNRYKLNLFLSIVMYSFILSLLTISNILMFLFFSAVNQIVSGIMMFHITEKNIDISRLSKNHTLRYEIIRGSYCAASLIFLPLGTLLTSFMPIEILILIVVMMSLASITPFYFLEF